MQIKKGIALLPNGDESECTMKSIVVHSHYGRVYRVHTAHQYIMSVVLLVVMVRWLRSLSDRIFNSIEPLLGERLHIFGYVTTSLIGSSHSLHFFAPSNPSSCNGILHTVEFQNVGFA